MTWARIEPALALLLAALSSCVFAQEPASVPLIGVLRASSAVQYDRAMDAMRLALRSLEYVEGRNLKIEQRFANRRVERLPRLAEGAIR